MGHELRELPCRCCERAAFTYRPLPSPLFPLTFFYLPAALYLGLFGLVPLQLSQVGNMLLQFTKLKIYHQDTFFPSLDPPTAYSFPVFSRIDICTPLYMILACCCHIAANKNILQFCCWLRGHQKLGRVASEGRNQGAVGAWARGRAGARLPAPAARRRAAAWARACLLCGGRQGVGRQRQGVSAAAGVDWERGTNVHTGKYREWIRCGWA